MKPSREILRTAGAQRPGAAAGQGRAACRGARVAQADAPDGRERTNVLTTPRMRAHVSTPLPATPGPPSTGWRRQPRTGCPSIRPLRAIRASIHPRICPVHPVHDRAQARPGTVRSQDAIASTKNGSHQLPVANWELGTGNVGSSSPGPSRVTILGQHAVDKRNRVRTGLRNAVAHRRPTETHGRQSSKTHGTREPEAGTESALPQQ